MTSFEKLKTKLTELFQLDQADLDFGIYRIMNARRDEINRFLDSDLLPQVREAFREFRSRGTRSRSRRNPSLYNRQAQMDASAS